MTPAVIHSKDSVGDTSAAPSPLPSCLPLLLLAGDQKDRNLFHEELYHNMFADDDGPLGDVLSKQCFNAYLDIGWLRYENFLLGNWNFFPELLPINQVKLLFENLVIIEGH